MKKIIGITGGIGSGKTTVANCIVENGFPVYNSDYWAKELVSIDADLKKEIIQLLGDESYDDTGKYNRKWVASVVFQNEILLKKLNHIIHPAVAQHFSNWVSAQTSEIVFKETALLFELQLHLHCWKTILVTADDEIRIQRTMQRDHKTYAEVLGILQKQMPEIEKIPLADFVIYNNTNIENLQSQTLDILHKLQY